MKILIALAVVAGLATGLAGRAQAQPMPSISPGGFGPSLLPPLNQPPKPLLQMKPSELQFGGGSEVPEREILKLPRRPEFERPADPGSACCVVGAPCCGGSAPEPMFEPIRFEEDADDRQFCDGRTPQKLPLQAPAVQAGAAASPAAGAGGNCVNPFGWPAEVVEEICSRRHDPYIDRCRPAYQALIAFRQFDLDAGGVEYYFDLAKIAQCRGLSREEARRQYLALTRTYNENCLDRFDAGAGSALGPGHMAVLADSVGELTHRDRPGLVCTGVVAEGMILTARHCLSEQFFRAVSMDGFRFETKSGRRIENLAGARVAATPYYQGDREYFHDGRRPNEDVVAIVPAGDQALDSPIRLGSAVPGEKIVLVGFNQNLKNEDYFSGREFAAGEARFSRYFAISYRASCRVFYTTDHGCVMHACQTDPSSSGAPLLAVRDGQVVLVGIQSGSLDHARNSVCLPEDNAEQAKYITNVAAAVDRLVKE